MRDLPKELRINKLIESRDLDISVIVPCYYKHAYLLKNLVNVYRYQTYLPKEMIISLSDTKKLSKKTLEDVKSILKMTLPFEVKIIFYDNKKLPGGNKNMAANEASGDILVVQDADDIPHLQRLELIKHMFDTYDIVHLGHKFINRKNSKMIMYDKYRKLRFNRKFKFDGIIFYRRLAETKKLRPKKYKFHITNGEIAILRSIWMDNRWDPKIGRGEDVKLNRIVEERYKKSIHIRKKLMLYNRIKQIPSN